MRKKYKITLATGIIILGIGLPLTAMGKINAALAGVFNAVAICLIMIAIIRNARDGNQPTKDERINKLAAKGLSVSWLLTMFTLLEFHWIDYLKLWEITVQQVIWITYIIMVLSAVTTQQILYRKGESV